MKKLIYLFILVLGMLAQFNVLSQGVAINEDNSTPDASAMLDVKSTTKGLLIPSMTTAQRNAIVSPANGLMIYQTDNSPGFYYNSGTSVSAVWVIAGTGSGWGLTGNSGTSASTNFIGTTDNVPITFKVNSELAGKIDHILFNTSSGYQSLNSNTTGSANTANGTSALYSNKANSQSTAIGYNAMYYADDRTTGRVTYNTAIGVEALKGSTTASNNIGQWNTAVGYQSMFSNISGDGNTATGVFSLKLNTSGSNNAVYGGNAMMSNTSGIWNSAFGTWALENNLNGAYNTAIGSKALSSNTTGHSNVALGINALFSNTTRSNLVAIGDSALFNNGLGATISVEAIGNTAVGSKALFSNTTGFWNTANGSKALYYNIDGSYNTANGNGALYYNTTGSANIAVGFQALAFNTSGYGNTAIGKSAMISNTDGDYNTAIGGNAMYGNNGGNYNTAIGWEAMQDNLVGNWNTCIGEYTNTSVGNLQGASSFGASAITNGDNKIVIGANVAGMVIGGYANWANLSDGRFKEDIKEDVPGLAFISLLRPVTYWVNTDKLQRHITAQMPDSIAQRYLPTSEEQANDREYTHTGFVAQEVEATAKAIGYAFDGVNAPKNPTDNYSIAYSQFVPSLVKAVQEQQTIIDDQNKKIDELSKRIEKLESK